MKSTRPQYNYLWSKELFLDTKINIIYYNQSNNYYDFYILYTKYFLF